MLVPLLFFASLVNDVRGLIAHNDMAAAEAEIRRVEAQNGDTPEVAVAYSWLARGALNARSYDRADSFAIETRKLCDKLLAGRKLDAEPNLPLALGASIEVHAQVLQARGERSEGVAFLEQQLKLFGNTSIVERVRKNVNLLSLEGKPAPALDEHEYLGPQPRSLSELRGHPVLLFFWAHWCGDCKHDSPMLADLIRQFAPKGLVAIAPTRFYGYVAGGADAPPAQEKSYIEDVWKKYYPGWSGVSVPLSGANFQTYGASTTPTIVLIDGGGIVRYYHPGSATAAELTARMQAVIGK